VAVTCLLTSVLLPAGKAWAQEQDQAGQNHLVPAWKIGSQAELQHYTSDTETWTPWVRLGGFVSYELTRQRLSNLGIRDRGSLRLSGAHVRRFDQADPYVEADLYLDLWPKAYFNFRLGVSPDADVLADVDAHLELYQAIIYALELSLSYRRIHFDRCCEADVNIFGASAAKYVGNFYFVLRGGVVRKESTARLAPTILGAGRWYFSSKIDTFIELGASFEQMIERVSTSDEARNSAEIYVRAEAFPWTNFGFALKTNAALLERVPPRLGGGGALMARW